MEGSFCRQPFMGEGRIIPELRRTKRRIFKEWVVTFPERVPYKSCLSEACHSSSLSCLYRACHRTCHSSRFTTETGNLKAYDVDTESHWNNGISGSFGPCQARGRALELHQTPWRRHPLPLCSLPTQPTLLPLKRLCLLNLTWLKMDKDPFSTPPAADTGLSPCVLGERRGVGGSVHRGELETSQDHFSTKWTFEHFKTHWAKLLPNTDLRKKNEDAISSDHCGVSVVTEEQITERESKTLLTYLWRESHSHDQTVPLEENKSLSFWLAFHQWHPVTGRWRVPGRT